MDQANGLRSAVCESEIKQRVIVFFNVKFTSGNAEFWLKLVSIYAMSDGESLVFEVLQEWVVSHYACLRHDQTRNAAKNKHPSFHIHLSSVGIDACILLSRLPEWQARLRDCRWLSEGEPVLPRPIRSLPLPPGHR